MNRRTLLTGIGLLTAGGAAGAAAGLAAEPALNTESPTARTVSPSGSAAYRATVTFRTAPSARLVALTFDDGPTREWTPQVLNMLRRHGAKTTFFQVGERAQADPGAVSRATDAGHEVANHTWAHSDLTHHDEAFDRASLERTHELLTKLLEFVRYEFEQPKFDVDETLRRASPGSIVLAHDGGPQPNATLMQQLDRLVGSMTDSGYTFVTVSELLAASR